MPDSIHTAFIRINQSTFHLKLKYLNYTKHLSKLRKRQLDMTEFVEIDGSLFEGGGQALRNALSLCVILNRPVRVVKIRANRPKPGLAKQHLHGVNLLRDMTHALVKGNEMYSTELEFTPRTLIVGGPYEVSTGTAASITLIYQMILPVLLYVNANSCIEIEGGTNVSFAPPVEYMQQVLQPYLKRFGVNFDLKVVRHGFYPRGGGSAYLYVDPLRSLKAAQFTDFGQLQSVKGTAFYAGRLPMSVADDMQHSAEREIHRLWPDNMCRIEAIKLTSESSRYDGAGIILTALTNSGCVLGSAAAVWDKNCDGHTIGSNASCELTGYIKNEICVDQHMQDQLIIYMALAKGCSRIRTGAMTNHTRTAIYVAELMTGVKFIIEYGDFGQTLISCEGIGQRNPSSKIALTNGTLLRE